MILSQGSLDTLVTEDGRQLVDDPRRGDTVVRSKSRNKTPRPAFGIEFGGPAAAVILCNNGTLAFVKFHDLMDESRNDRTRVEHELDELF